jgi:tetratricopeptide (TPR) repeat protein
MKICVYAISKNEEFFVERFCKAAKGADMILIADTGSTDNTVELARSCGAVVPEIHISPWRFDLARNAALALIPRDIDICISLDLDEILEPGWREEIERVWNDETTRLRYKYNWGNGIEYFYEKIHHRHGYHWHHPCHEYPRTDARIKEVCAHTNMLLVSHHPDPLKSRGQYMELLELSVKEDPSCPRNMFYYARELTFYRKWVDAIVALHKYLENPKSNWATERCYAMRLLSQSYEALGDAAQAENWLHKATKEAPNTREPWVELSDFARKSENWELSYNCAKKAIEINNKDLVYSRDPSVWGARPHDLLALAAYYLGYHDEAFLHGSKAIDLEPENARLKRNLEFYSAYKNKEQ